MYSWCFAIHCSDCDDNDDADMMAVTTFARNSRVQVLWLQPRWCICQCTLAMKIRHRRVSCLNLSQFQWYVAMKHLINDIFFLKFGHVACDTCDCAWQWGTEEVFRLVYMFPVKLRDNQGRRFSKPPSVLPSEWCGKSPSCKPVSYFLLDPWPRDVDVWK